jgi:4-diphosphocytidyl-2-C-methyl-D-erythritol kinase
MHAFSLPSPAKINHLLHIIGRREDGYHLLQTLFQFIDFNDFLSFEAREDGKLVIVSEGTPCLPPEDNLIYKAARLLQKTASSPVLGATITLQKNIPMGAGLGGGSSNAATTLIGLNHLWSLSLPLEKLMHCGLSLGADVPVFLLGKSAWGEGIGETLTPIQLTEPWIALITPACHVTTSKMYASTELTRNTSPFRIGTLADDEIKNIIRGGKNDFEPVVCRHFPEVDNTMKWLSNFGKARLSGSGASVFSCFDDERSAREVIEQLPPSLEGRAVKALNLSPLHQAAESLGMTCTIGVSPSGKAQGFDPCIPRFES